ncbi:hypothetical protein FisN_24Hh048 [Fistulifera solaris]|uniref:Sulfotransferase domain-containing protein n=1 Tax=Fistulifera solaris TaxID=1519565 RepID=A0A1Z5JEN7_FISSO|nr:hypothetical protein FisN_24Hh048 [Fistulifera solaris]|eukprot:GAX12474.1 hypothetical protein FisN_24Hh048 [Fistulifera solaris]
MARRQSLPVTVLFILFIVVLTYLVQMNQIDMTSFQEVWSKATSDTATQKTTLPSLRFVWDSQPTKSTSKTTQPENDDSSDDSEDDDDDVKNDNQKDKEESKDDDEESKDEEESRDDDQEGSKDDEEESKDESTDSVDDSSGGGDSDDANDGKSLRKPPRSSSTIIPKVAWLASYPNSGTSYTMTTVERSTDLSTATMYGIEIATKDKDTSEVVTPGGPLWEGMSGKRGTTIRPLPTTYVLTKTHCGGRCIKCPATEYVIDVEEFRQACLRTTGYDPPRQRFERQMKVPVAKILHLIRSPFTNIVARFHLEQRHYVREGNNKYERDADGFRQWCKDLDKRYSKTEHLVWQDDPALKELFLQVPCRAEFYKYTQWHNHLFQLRDMLSNPKDDYLVVHYEDYETNLNATIGTIMDFLEQEVVNPLREFRPLPDYADHFSKSDRRRVRQLVQYMSSSETWSMLERYLD